MRQFGIWCEVWGGVTGSREAWMKRDGKVHAFLDEQEAIDEAARLNKDRNHSNAKAYFHYEAREVRS